MYMDLRDTTRSMTSKTIVLSRWRHTRDVTAIYHSGPGPSGPFDQVDWNGGKADLT